MYMMHYTFLDFSVDVIQNWFNENPKENYKLLDPIVESDGKLYYLPLVQSVLSLIQSDINFQNR